MSGAVSVDQAEVRYRDRSGRDVQALAPISLELAPGSFTAECPVSVAAVTKPAARPCARFTIRPGASNDSPPQPPLPNI